MTQQPPAAPTLHPKRCETCDIHKKVCNNLPYYYGKDLPHPSSGCTLYDMMDTEPDFSDAYWNAIALVGCASHYSTPGADARQRIDTPTELPEEMPFTPDEIPQKKFVIIESEFRKMFDAWMFSTKNVRELHTIQNKVQSRAISIGHTSGCDCARCRTYKKSGYYLCEECYTTIALMKDGVERK
jgi:hypothetical protein